MAFEISGKIIAKAGNGKGFKISSVDGWFNASAAASSFLSKVEKGDEVTVAYEKKGVSKICTKITKSSAKGNNTQSEEQLEVSEFVCEECGKALKDGKYKKCWACNQKSPKTEASKSSDKPYIPRVGGYGSAEDIAGKEVGCAAGVAGNILSGRQEDPETLLEMFRILSNGILEHIRSLK